MGSSVVTELNCLIKERNETKRAVVVDHIEAIITTLLRRLLSSYFYIVILIY